jgi:hypothetical protein
MAFFILATFLRYKKSNEKGPAEAGPDLERCDTEPTTSGNNRRNAGGLGAFRARRQIIAHTLTFLQAAKAFGVNCRKVDEDIVATILGGNKAKSLGIVEPLHCSVWHFLLTSIGMWWRASPYSRRPHSREYA